jgi:hypothetical protein
MRCLAFSLVAVLALAGCQGQAPAPVPPPAAAPVEPAAVSSPATEPAQPAPAAQPNFSGRVATFRGPIAQAAVTVTLLGRPGAVATATTDAEGRFALALPATVAPGTLLKLTAVRDGRTLRAIAGAPGARRTQAEDAPALTDATTLATIMLDKRFEAAGQASRNAQGATDSQTATDTLSAYNTLVGACETALGGQSETTRDAVASAQGEGDLDASLRGSPALRNAFFIGASALDGVIRDGVNRGGAEPAAELLAPASFGGQTTGAVSLRPPASGGGGSSPRSNADGAVVVQDGKLAHEGVEGSRIVD